MLIKTFLNDESGAVTVDWVVLTAALVGLGLAVMAVISTGVEDLTNDVEGKLSDGSIIRTAFNGSVIRDAGAAYDLADGAGGIPVGDARALGGLGISGLASAQEAYTTGVGDGSIDVIGNYSANDDGTVYTNTATGDTYGADSATILTAQANSAYGSALSSEAASRAEQNRD